MSAVDPPYAPIEDRMVSNVTREGPMTPQQDYLFQTTVTWNPPIYPYKDVQMYLLKWSKETSNARSGFEFAGFTTTVSLVAFYFFLCSSVTELGSQSCSPVA